MKEQQVKVLKFIYDYRVEHGWPPSIREIRLGVGLKSTSSVWYWLESLVGDGYITREPAISRGIHITLLGQEELVKRKMF